MSQLTQGGPVALTPKEFHYAFANTLGREESDTQHARYGTRPSGPRAGARARQVPA